jgi:type III secretion system YscQ/HrcQ family protein
VDATLDKRRSRSPKTPDAGDAPSPLGKPLALPRLDPAHTALQNHLLGAAACSRFEASGAQWTWRWAAQPETLPTLAVLELRSEVSVCELHVQQEAPGLVDAAFDLAAYEDVALCLAGSLRYAALIEHLGKITQCEWTCSGVTRGMPANGNADRWALAFAVQGPAAGKQTAAPCGLGQIRIAPEHSALWLRGRGHAPAANAAWSGLTVPLDVRLAHTVPLPHEQLRKLSAGAALLLGRAPSDGMPCLLTLPDGRPWRQGVLRHQQIQILGGDTSSAHSRRPLMSTATATDLLPGATDAALQALPIDIEVHVGRINLPWSDLGAKLAAGQVVELGPASPTPTVSLRANGLALATGELVQVGDMLAVRIHSVAAHGSV